MKINILATTIAIALLGGCEATSLFDIPPVVMLPPESGEANVNFDGTIDTILINTNVGQEVDGDGNGFGYVVGYYPNEPGTGGFAGITAATNLGTQPISGIAAMSGAYRLTRLDNLALDSSDRPAGSTQSLSEQITLTADFGLGTLTGSQNDLTVNGQMSAGDLSGTVTYDGLDGTLTGEVGPDEAVGAFYGSDANTVFAGGFFVRE